MEILTPKKPKLWKRNKGINLGSDIPQMDE
jgi:hypothetical protein